MGGHLPSKSQFGANIFPLKDAHDRMRARHAFTNDLNEKLLEKNKI